MERFYPSRFEELDAAQAALYRTIVTGKRANSLHLSQANEAGEGLPGPFGPMLLNPPVGDSLQEVGAILRYQGVLEGQFREIVTVVAGGAFDCSYELRAHLPLLRATGLGDRVIDDLLQGNYSSSSHEVALVARAARTVAEVGFLDDELLKDLAAFLKDDEVFELIVIVGYYRILASILATYKIE